MQSLLDTAHRHDTAIQAHVERLPALADGIVNGPSEELLDQFHAECRFITGQLVPHIKTVEAVLYPVLEKQLGGVHSLSPMREEHLELNRLMRSLCLYRDRLEAGRLGSLGQQKLRRALYRLYSILKMHLAREQRLVGLLDVNLPDVEKDSLARSLHHATVELI